MPPKPEYGFLPKTEKIKRPKTNEKKKNNNGHSSDNCYLNYCYPGKAIKEHYHYHYHYHHYYYYYYYYCY